MRRFTRPQKPSPNQMETEISTIYSKFAITSFLTRSRLTQCWAKQFTVNVPKPNCHISNPHIHLPHKWSKLVRTILFYVQTCLIHYVSYIYNLICMLYPKFRSNYIHTENSKCFLIEHIECRLKYVHFQWLIDCITIGMEISNYSTKFCQL